MFDYGQKLLEAKQMSTKIQMLATESILFNENHNHSVSELPRLTTDYEQSSFEELPKKLPISLNRKIILFNNLGWKRIQLVKVVVEKTNVKVIGPDGRNIVSQV